LTATERHVARAIGHALGGDACRTRAAGVDRSAQLTADRRFDRTGRFARRIAFVLAGRLAICSALRRTFVSALTFAKILALADEEGSHADGAARGVAPSLAGRTALDVGVRRALRRAVGSARRHAITARTRIAIGRYARSEVSLASRVEVDECAREWTLHLRFEDALLSSLIGEARARLASALPDTAGRDQYQACRNSGASKKWTGVKHAQPQMCRQHEPPYRTAWSCWEEAAQPHSGWRPVLPSKFKSDNRSSKSSSCSCSGADAGIVASMAVAEVRSGREPTAAAASRPMMIVRRKRRRPIKEMVSHDVCCC
jgi:hypothetical protein